MAARKAVEQELTKEMIMDAARELFATEGYRHVTMRKLARKLGYSHGALYYHFKNKAELFYELVEQDFALLNEKLDELMREGGITNREKLENILLGFIEFGVSHPHHYEIMFLTNVSELQVNVQQGPNESFHKFATAVQTLCGEKVTPQTVWSVFLSLHGFVTHYCHCELQYEEWHSAAVSHVHFLIKGIG